MLFPTCAQTAASGTAAGAVLFDSVCQLHCRITRSIDQSTFTAQCVASCNASGISLRAATCHQKCQHTLDSALLLDAPCEVALTVVKHLGRTLVCLLHIQPVGRYCVICHTCCMPGQPASCVRSCMWLVCLCRGHLRTNACGANLNREWKNPSMDRSPEIVAVSTAIAATGGWVHTAHQK
jgi:hypothetical protein